MAQTPVRILSLAPYRVLPATTGGHWGIVSMHDALGRVCEDHVLGTADNGDADGYAFTLHRVFEPKPRRYIPRTGFSKALALAQRHGATHIFCDHPYMAPLANALSTKLNIPWALRSHNIESERFRLLGKRWWRGVALFERWAMRAADVVFFITPEDLQWGRKHYGIDVGKCRIAPYGTELKAAPGGHSEAKAHLAKSLDIDISVPWLYFLGVQSYAPNAEAVGHIISEVMPRLKAAGVRCEIVIGGKGLPAHLAETIAQTDGIRYTGFIEDLDAFILACDVMLNPITSGGGIKTKAVEALGYNKIVVSTANGAAGIDPAVCGGNLIIAADEDWDGFAAGVYTAVARVPAIPRAFYERYNWDAVARSVVDVLGGL